MVEILLSGGMPNPLISVIIPTRNRRDLVLRAVRSVLRQDHPHRQILVVDDGSTDGTVEALAGEPGCRVIRQEAGGPAAARNTGITAAEGEYLAFLDSDDYWLENHLSTLLAAMADPRVGLAYCPTKTVTLDSEPLGGRRDCRKCYSGQVAERLFRHVFIHTSNVLCRSDLVRQAGCFDTSLSVCEDYHLWLRLALRCEMAAVEPVTSMRCWHGRALSRQDRLRNVVVRAAMLERFYLREGGREAIPARSACKRLGKVFFQAGRSLARAGQGRDAMGFFRRSVRYRPWQFRGWTGLGACWMRPGQSDPQVVQQLLGGLAWSLRGD